MIADVNDPFSFPDITWHRLDDRMVTVTRFSSAISNLIIIAAGSLAAWFWFDWQKALIFAIAWTLWTGFVLWRNGRRIRSWRYGERGEDFCVRYGLMRRHLKIIPYGRIQTVSVSDGPLMRNYGLATVSIKTVAIGGETNLAGLKRDAAETLRDRLLEKAEDRKPGL